MRRSDSYRRTAVPLLGLLLLTLAACAPRVTRIEPDQAIDLSGRWNDVDSRMVAEAIISQSFQSPHGPSWSVQHAQRNGGTVPTVIVGTVRNRSMEHIPVALFVRDLERAYVNSGQVRVVASRDEREEVREERMDQQEWSSPQSRSRLQRETGAEYMLQGDIQSIEDSERGRRVVYYQVDVTLVNLETNAKTWVGQHRIKKFIERPRLGF
jgi:hypothetical protein